MSPYGTCFRGPVVTSIFHHEHPEIGKVLSPNSAVGSKRGSASIHSVDRLSDPPKQTRHLLSSFSPPFGGLVLVFLGCHLVVSPSMLPDSHSIRFDLKRTSRRTGRPIPTSPFRRRTRAREIGSRGDLDVVLLRVYPKNPGPQTHKVLRVQAPAMEGPTPAMEIPRILWVVRIVSALRVYLDPTTSGGFGTHGRNGPEAKLHRLFGSPILEAFDRRPIPQESILVHLSIQWLSSTMHFMN